MGVVYRTDGAWGVGQGSDLSAVQIDTNFYTLVQDIAAKAVQGVGIANFNVVGDQLTVVLTDHTLLGPYTLPTSNPLNPRGVWQPSTQYYVDDLFAAPNGNAYTVAVQHVSATTFDPAATDGMGHNLYVLFLPSLSGAPISTTSPLDKGQVLAYNGSDFSNTSVVDVPCDTGTTVSGSIAVDRSVTDVRQLTLSGDTTITGFTGWPSAGQFARLVLRIDNTGGHTLAFPTVKWPGGVAPTISNGIDIYLFVTMDGGTTVHGNIIGQNYL